MSHVRAPNQIRQRPSSEPKCSTVITVVAPGATELPLVQLLSQLRQLNSGELELTTTLQQHYFSLPARSDLNTQKSELPVGIFFY